MKPTKFKRGEQKLGKTLKQLCLQHMQASRPEPTAKKQIGNGLLRGVPIQFGNLCSTMDCREKRNINRSKLKI